MTTFQKTVKYIAMAFAIFLTVSIIGGILSMFGLFGGFFSGDAVTEDVKTYSVSSEIQSLEVKINAADFTIKQGESFSVESNLKHLAHADPYVPSMPISKVVKEELSDDINRRIFVFERTSQFELLSRNLETFMWVSPIPKSLLERYNLVQKECSENRKIYKDLLIYKNGYKLSKLDRQFITELCESKRKYL